MTLITAYITLALAIIFEVTGTTFLMKSDQFARLGPTLLMAVFYAASFYLLSLTLKTIPLAVAYALWGGLGIVLTTVIGVLVFNQTLDFPAVGGIALIVSGVILLNGFSETMTH